ncbi:hypothetical protein SAMN05421504_1011439 [Amycolatopsis xylanica]|uniref:DoxX-like family protein n=1 Tax=Amycolatopsis xylanica TaxID=589385 RepID=A0A1H2W7F0_9PSEU|nr:hypothetical protein [Amycolatopsis xylanica]SDW76184.1 hypothetical protein SAMN05421504_1011439 [Amycolatopsis xylanica]
MNNLTIRLALLIPFGEELVVGGWNQLFPRGFYDNFPTVDLTPPFSEHFARDFGGATLGLALILGIALVKPKTHFVVPAALAYLAFAVPHFFFHLLNMDAASHGQKMFLTIGNAAVALFALAAIALAVGRDRRSAE